MKEYEKKKRDAVLMGIILIAALVLYFVISPAQISMSKKTAAMPFNPATFPNLLTLGIIVTSAIGLVLYTVNCLKLKKQYADEIAEAKAERAAAKAAAAEAPFSVKIAPFVPYITFVLVLAYALIFTNFGFIWATVIIPPIMLFFLGSRKWQHYVSVYAFCAIMFAVFKFILKVPIK